jgi:hypothetical protein
MSFFGSSRKVQAAKQFASPEYSILTVSGSKGQLIQSVRGEFGRRVDSIPVVGDPNVYWGFGNAEGQVTVGRYVGCGGFFEGWRTTKCGIIESIGIKAGDGDDCVCAAGGITFSQGAVLAVSFGLTAGETTIQESIVIKVGDLSVGN